MKFADAIAARFRRRPKQPSADVVPNRADRRRIGYQPRRYANRPLQATTRAQRRMGGKGR